jgi:FKBP-type peptidyl-prolyl cis-trans isomerase FkpA
MRGSLLAALAIACACGAPRDPRPVVTDDDRTLHALGLTIAKYLDHYELSPDELERVLDGVRAGRRNQGAVKLEDWTPRVGTLEVARLAARAEARRREDAARVAPITSAPGARRLPSGVVVVSTREGAGPAPAATDFVEIEFRGTLADGTEIDSTAARGRPMRLPLDRALPCWSEGIPLMKVGGKARLVCPSESAYGDRGNPPIPGGATLVYDVELLSIGKP